MGLPLTDRRAVVEAILKSEHIPVLRSGELRNGLLVAPNGLVIRVVTANSASPARLEILRRWLALAESVLVAGGIEVYLAQTGVELSIGTIPSSRKEVA